MSTTTADHPGALAAKKPALAPLGAHLLSTLAAGYGALVLVLWVVAYRLNWAGPVPAVMWHVHEMIYGFAAAGGAGIFAALTPSWSGAPPIANSRLGTLAVIWVLGRVGMAGAGFLPAWLAAAVVLLVGCSRRLRRTARAFHRAPLGRPGSRAALASLTLLPCCCLVWYY